MLTTCNDTWYLEGSLELNNSEHSVWRRKSSDVKITVSKIQRHANFHVKRDQSVSLSHKFTQRKRKQTKNITIYSTALHQAEDLSFVKYMLQCLMGTVSCEKKKESMFCVWCIFKQIGLIAFIFHPKAKGLIYLTSHNINNWNKSKIKIISNSLYMHTINYKFKIFINT